MIYPIEKITPFGLLIKANKKYANLFDLDQIQLQKNFTQHHLVILRGFNLLKKVEDFLTYCSNWGEIAEWPFGKVLELKEHNKPQDHIFDNSYIPLHWDGMYRPQVPEMQIFQCVVAPEPIQGGQTTFSNTIKVLEKATTQQKELWAKVIGVYQRKMEFYHSKTKAPIIVKHPTQNFSVIRYCEPPIEGDKSFINHPDLMFSGIPFEFIKPFQQDLKKALYATENFYAHTWQTGDIILSNNHCLLHGRKSFSKGSARHIRRVHIIDQNLKTNPHLVFHK